MPLWKPHRVAGGQRVVNWPLLLGTVAVLVVVAPALWFWHHYQLQRSASVYLQRANQLEETQEWAGAAKYLHRYLRLRPEDAPVQIRLAKTFDRAATELPSKQRSAEFYLRAIGLAPDDLSLRQRLCELCWELGRWQEAIEHAERILQVEPQQPRALRLRALCLHALSRNGGPVPIENVLSALHECVEFSPGETDVAYLLATLIRDTYRGTNPAEVIASADALLDYMRHMNHESPDAWMVSYAYRKRYQLPNPGEDVDRALALAPDHLQALLAAAGEELPAQKYALAEAHYRRAMEVAPRDYRGYEGLGDVFLAQQKAVETEQAWKQGLEQCGREHLVLHARLAELCLAQNRLPEAEQSLDILERGLRPEAAALDSSLEKLTLAVQLLRARWWLAQGRSLEAQPLLKQVALHRHAQASIMLGEIYKEQQAWDLAAASFEQAAQLQPTAWQPLWHAAQTWRQAQRPDLALHVLLQVTKRVDAAEVWLALAQTSLEVQMSLPQKERTWDTFQQAWQKFQEFAGQEGCPQPWRGPLLKVYAELSKTPGVTPTQIDALLPVLKTAAETWPGEADLWSELCVIYINLEQTELAGAAFDHYQELTDTTADGLSFRLGFLAKIGRWSEAEAMWQNGQAALAPLARQRMLQTLIPVAWQRQRRDLSSQWLLTLAEMPQLEANSIQLLLEACLQQSDFAGAERWEQELARKEPAPGWLARYYKARRLAAQSATNPEALKQAVELQVQLEAERPMWSRVQSLKGWLAEKQGQPQQAVAAYQAAVRLGEQDLAVWERMLALYLALNRFQEAEQCLQRLPRGAVMGSDLAWSALQVTAHQGKWGEALDLARTKAEREPNNAAWQVVHGRLAAATQQVEEATTAFQRALVASPENPAAWLEMIRFQVQQSKLADAQATLELVTAQPKLRMEDKALIHLQAGELAPELQAAQPASFQTLIAQTTDRDLLQRLADYYEPRDPERALAVARRGLELSPNDAATKRKVALAWARIGAPESWKQALAWLTKNPATLNEEDSRTVAFLLAEYGAEPERLAAVTRLEKLLAQTETPLVTDRLFLARLYEIQGQTAGARAQLELAVQDDPSLTAGHAALVEFLLRQEAWDEAAARWSRLQLLAPRELETIRLRARYLQLQSPEQLPGYLALSLNEQRESAGPSFAQAELLLKFAELATNLELPEVAEPWYREVVAELPHAFPLLVLNLQQQQRLDDAVELCLTKRPPEFEVLTGLAAATLLALAPRDVPQRSELESLVVSAISAHGSEPELLFAAANWKVSEGNHATAETWYRRALTLAPRHVGALNNLATLLAQNPDTVPQALDLLNQAVRTAGRRTEFLDTKGICALTQNKAREAVPLLREAVLGDHDPRYQLHLAYAYHQLGQHEPAQAAFQKALRRGVTRALLTPVERKMLSAFH